MWYIYIYLFARHVDAYSGADHKAVVRDHGAWHEVQMEAKKHEAEAHETGGARAGAAGKGAGERIEVEEMRGKLAEKNALLRDAAAALRKIGGNENIAAALEASLLEDQVLTNREQVTNSTKNATTVAMEIMEKTAENMDRKS